MEGWGEGECAHACESKERQISYDIAYINSILAWKIGMDRGAWGATIRGVTESQMQLSTHTFAFHISGEMIGYIISSF